MCHFDQIQIRGSVRRVISADGYGGNGYDPLLDSRRLNAQQDRIRDWMLGQDNWRTLAEMRAALDYPESSISAQLRHLRKTRFGGYLVEKRRRLDVGGIWEYRVIAPENVHDGTSAAVPKTSPTPAPQLFETEQPVRGGTAVPKTHDFETGANR